MRTQEICACGGRGENKIYVCVLEGKENKKCVCVWGGVRTRNVCV